MKGRDLAAMFLLAALWGSSFLFIRIGAPLLGPFTLAFTRVTLAGAALWIVMRALGTRAELRPLLPRLLMLGALNAAIPFSLIAAAELRLTASLAAMLNATVPLWGSLFGVLWLGERITMKRTAGLLLGVAGVAILVGWSPVTMDLATVLSVLGTLVATASYAMAGVWTKKRLAGVPTTTLALGQQVGAAAWLLIPALVQGRTAQPTGAAVSAVVTLALLCTALAYPLYFHLVKSVGPTKTTTVTYLIPLFGTTWGALFLHEPVTRGMLAGLTLILGSVLLVNDVRVGALFRKRAPARC